MNTISFYKDSNNLWVFNGMIVPAGNLVIDLVSDTEIGFRWLNKNLSPVFKKPILITNITKENGTSYNDITEFKSIVKDFFVNATQDVASPIISISYNDLYTLTQTSGLTIGQKYIINDYQTVHVIPNTGTLDNDTGLIYGEDINTCPIEPLLVESLTTSKIANECKSTLFPEDIIYYNIENNQDMVSGCTKGYIYRRIDTIRNNDICLDYRNVKFRRWQVYVTEQHIDGNSSEYVKYDVVKKTNTDIIYVKISDEQGLFTNDNIWCDIKIKNLSYVSVYNTNIEIFNSNIILPINSNYMDYKMFSTEPTINGVESNYENIYNNKIIIAKISVISDNNILFFCNNNTPVYSNTFHGSCYENTIITEIRFSDNTFGYNILNNLLYGEFTSCKIGSEFEGNTILNGLNYTSISENSSNNLFLNSISRNIIGDGFQSNIIYSMYDNNIGNGFDGNVVGNNFNSNFIENNFNKIGGLDFTSAFYVYQDFNKILYTDLVGNQWLRYYNSSNILTTVSANSIEII